jgi:Tol biopolymer transport system component
VIADIDGSAPTVLLSDKEKWIQPRAFSPDGKQVLLSRPGGTDAGGAERISLSLLSIADRSIRTLTVQSDYGSLGFSPDGRFLAGYRISTHGGILPGPLKLIPTDGSREVPLFESEAKNWSPFWTPDGRNIFFLSDRSGVTDLWSIAVSDGKAEGEPRRRRSDVGPIAMLGFTADGALYYKSTKNDQGDIFAADIDPATGLVISEPVRFNQNYVGSTGFPAAWSPDGRFFAYTRRAYLAYNKSRIASFIIRTEATGEEREVHPVPADAFNQAYPFPNTLKWFLDGRSLLATDFVTGKGLVFRQVDLETGQVKVLLDLKEASKSVWSPNISPDGKVLYYVEADTEFYCLMRRDLQNGDESALYKVERNAGSIDALALSTDGRLLAFVLSHHGRKAESLMVMPVEGGTPRELFKSEFAMNHIAWTRDDRHVMMEYYLKGDPSRMVASVSIEGGEPKTSPFATGLTAVHPNGRWIAFYSGKGGNEEVWAFRNLLSQPAK